MVKLLKLAVALVTVAAAALSAQTLGTAGLAAASLLYFVPGNHPQPLDLVGSGVRQERITLTSPTVNLDANLFAPSTPGRHPALVIVHGWARDAELDPEAIRLGTALARSGHVVLVPHLALLRQGILDPQTIDEVVASVAAVRTRGDVDPTRVGLFGVCLGAAYVFSAAADPRMPPLREIVVANAYYDLLDMIQAGLTHTVTVGGRIEGWTPDVAVSNVVTINLEALGRQYPDAAPLLLRLQENRDPSLIRTLYDQLPAEIRQKLASASPADSIERVRAPVIMLQAAGDPVVPPGSLDRYRQALASRSPAPVIRESRLMRHDDLRAPDLTLASVGLVYAPGVAALLNWGYEVLATLDR